MTNNHPLLVANVMQQRSCIELTWEGLLHATDSLNPLHLQMIICLVPYNILPSQQSQQLQNIREIPKNSIISNYSFMMVKNLNKRWHKEKTLIIE